MNMTLSCVSSLMLFWVRVPKWIFPHLHIQSFLWNVLSESGRLPAKGSNSINSPASRMWCCGVPARGFHLWKPSRPCVLYAGPSLFCSQPWAMCRCVFTLHWATWNWTWQVHVMNLAWKLFPNTQYKVCARWCSEPVTTTSKFQASGVIWPMINQNALALLIQNKMMPAPSSTNPNPSTDPRLQALPPSPQHPQETPQLISLDRWKYCLAGAEASTRSMTPQRSAWLCQSVPTTSKPWCRLTLPEWHDLSQGFAAMPLLQMTHRKAEIQRTFVQKRGSLPQPCLHHMIAFGPTATTRPNYWAEHLSDAKVSIPLPAGFVQGLTPIESWLPGLGGPFQALNQWSITTVPYPAALEAGYLGFFGISPVSNPRKRSRKVMKKIIPSLTTYLT